MSKKRERRKRSQQNERRLFHAKAAVGVVLEQCSDPELSVLIRFFESRGFDSFLKISVLLCAAHQIRATRAAERKQERTTARKRTRQAATPEEKS